MSFTDAIADSVRRFVEGGGVGADPLAAVYPQRRAAWSLFANSLSDKEMESLRSYVLPWRKLPGDGPVRVHNLVAGEWRPPARGEFATLPCPADRRVQLMQVPASTAEDVEAAVTAADAYWKSLAWTEEVFGYKKWVVMNFSRLLQYFHEECLHEIRQQIPKTRLEAEKDFWEGKRAADHLGGSAEVALRGELIPPMLPGHTYWRDMYLPAGPAAVITPMNFIYGISAIQIVGAYMSGSPFVYKGHPYAALTNTTLIRMMLAAGADPRQLHKLEGFGGGIATLATDARITVVSVTGSSETARKIQAARGLRRVRFEGGGCNWSWVDDGYNDEELGKIAVRLTYSKLGLSSHKCTGLHGIAASRSTMERLLPLLDAEFGRWEVRDPRGEGEKVVGPLMVHKAQTALDLVAAAEKAGARVVRRAERVGGEYGANAEAVTPAILAGCKPGMTARVDWDGKGLRDVSLCTDEFFMPVLATSEMSFDEFLRFSVFVNPHDLSTSVWTRDDRKIQRGRRALGGMLKENDGTDSALEWEEFGASTAGESGNMGVGEAQATLAIYTRRQKGRHIVF